MRTYTKAQLEQVVMMQLENLDAMNDLLKVIKEQNELLHNVNKKLKEEISACKESHPAYSSRKRSLR
jgi:hypothetical protein